MRTAPLRWADVIEMTAAALQSPPWPLAYKRPQSAVLGPERFRAETCAFGGSGFDSAKPKHSLERLMRRASGMIAGVVLGRHAARAAATMAYLFFGSPALMQLPRRRSVVVQIGSVSLGGSNLVIVQSM